MTKRVRNVSCLPYLESEGKFIVSKDYTRKDVPCTILHLHHTLASARRNSHFKPHPNLIPTDALDLILTSTYNHTEESFPDPIDVHLQPETLGKPTWRRLKNQRDLTPEREEQAAAHAKKTVKDEVKKIRKRKVPYLYNDAHKVIIGGIIKNVHPSSVKLMNSSHHSPQTNAGYSRQDPIGTYYQY